MTYSKDSQIRKYVKGYGFMSFVKNSKIFKQKIFSI